MIIPYQNKNADSRSCSTALRPFFPSQKYLSMQIDEHNPSEVDIKVITPTPT